MSPLGQGFLALDTALMTCLARFHLTGRQFKKPVFWSHSYCIITCGGAPLSVIKQYIEQQEDPIDRYRGRAFLPPSKRTVGSGIAMAGVLRRKFG